MRIEIPAARLPSADAHGIRVSVRDNGPGLSQEQRERMFEPFYTTKTKGTGLGLAIAQRIVEAHGGQITVGEKTSAHGAEIVVTLPHRHRNEPPSGTGTDRTVVPPVPDGTPS